MAVAKWSPLSTESSNLGTTVNNKSTGSTTLVADIDNTSGANLYLEIWIDLAAITLTGGPSLTLSLRRKRESTYADNAIETFTGAVPTGSVARSVHAVMRIPNAGIYGLYWTNNLGTTTAASGNNLYYRTWNEDVD